MNYWQDYKEEVFYHIYNHASDDKNLFYSKEDYEVFLAKFSKYFLTYFDVFSYCLMPNHYHFLIKVKLEEEIKSTHIDLDSNAKEKYKNNEITLNELIEDQFRRLHSSHSLSINLKYMKKGQLFLNRHKRVSFLKEWKFHYLVCYIHHNPIHHNFCDSYSKWEFSSYNGILKNEENILVNIPLLIFEYGGLENFIQSHGDFKLNKENELNLER